jgi:hypothetical protein
VKISIDDVAVLDLDAPVLSAYEAKYRGVVRWFAWCKHRRERHDHGPTEGHWEAHCRDPSSPYWKSGYNLAYAGKWVTGRGLGSPGVTPMPGLRRQRAVGCFRRAWLCAIQGTMTFLGGGDEHRKIEDAGW